MKESYHGKVTGYNRGCRCPECMKAKIAHTRQWRAERRQERLRTLAREMLAKGEARPFRAPRCFRCGADLVDRRGEPFWDIISGRLVCPVLCRPAPPVDTLQP